MLTFIKCKSNVKIHPGSIKLSIVPSNQSFLYNSSVTFNCLSSENVHLSWRKDGQDLNTDQEGVKIKQNEEVSCLRLDNLKSSFVLECFSGFEHDRPSTTTSVSVYQVYFS